MEAQEAWDQLGEEGRALLHKHLDWLTMVKAPVRHTRPEAILRSVESMTCEAHPLERVAKAWGCTCAGCAGAMSLTYKKSLRLTLSYGLHAGALVAAFLNSPTLAFPPDIPEYALRACAFVKRTQMALLRRTARKQAKEQRAAQAAQAAARRQAEKESYAYRIAKAQVKREKIAEAIVAAEKRVKQLTARWRNANRSINALQRAAQAKGEKTETP
jgi:hypothetical protein